MVKNTRWEGEKERERDRYLRLEKSRGRSVDYFRFDILFIIRTYFIKFSS